MDHPRVVEAESGRRAGRQRRGAGPPGAPGGSGTGDAEVHAAGRAAVSRAGTGRAAIAVLAATLALAGCNRQPPRFVPPGADSALTMTADSLAERVDDALRRWEAQDGAGAGPATARLLVDDLRRHPDRRLVDRARTFVDSCGFSAEVSGSVDVALVNFFSRADPSGGSWPFLLWREAEAVRHQAVEGGGMRLLDLAVRPPAPEDDPLAGPATVAAIYSRASPRGPQPVVIVWRRPPEGVRWTLAQTLGPDSLGGVGVVEFVPQPAGGPGLEARTYRATAGFDECPTCPHIHRTVRFEWSPEGFRRTSEEVAASPYHAFVQLIAALSVNDREMALRGVSDPMLVENAERHEWGRSKGLWRVAPGTDESSTEMTFFRGRREAYRVRFASRDGRWVVSDLQPTQRAVE